MKVIILNDSFIPGLGRGPFKTPIEIKDEMYFIYKKMGLEIFNVTKSVPFAQTGVINSNRIKNDIEDYEKKIEQINIVDKKETSIEDENRIETKPVDLENDEKESSEEVTTENIITEESKIEDTETISDSDEESIDLESMTKKEIISLLTENGIEVDNKMNKSQLVDYAAEQLS